MAFPDNHFDAVVSVGVFTHGHAPTGSLDELLRIARPQGHMVFSLRTDVYESRGFKEKLAILETSGRWKLVEASEPLRTFAKKEQDVLQRIWVYEIGEEM